MTSLSDLLRTSLATLLPGELKTSELRHLLVPNRHPLLLCQRRAMMIVDRVRLFAFLFAVLTPLWSVIDLMVFDTQLWLRLAGFRLAACLAFTSLLVFYRPSGNLLDAYRAIAILFAIPTVFYIASHTLLGSYQLVQFSAVVGAGYAFLPFVLMAGLTIFPLTLLESLLLGVVLLLAQALAGYLSWATLNWPSFAGAFWLLILIAGVASLAGMSQLAFMVALVRQAIRDPLTGIFSRGSGEEILKLQWDSARRNNSALALAFIDLDHFKAINDRYGHEAGDEVLRDAARAARHAARFGQPGALGRRGVSADHARDRHAPGPAGVGPGHAQWARLAPGRHAADCEYRPGRATRRPHHRLPRAAGAGRPAHVRSQARRAQLPAARRSAAARCRVSLPAIRTRGVGS